MTYSRRDALKLAAIVGALPLFSGLGSPKAQAQTGRALPWRNWSGGQTANPAARVAPAGLDQLIDIVRTSPGPVRAVGAGHSFTPLVPTDGTILSLSRLSGLKDADQATVQATFGAGTRLGDIGLALDKAGQAMINMPDIDEQSLAGSIATGTHGTGASLTALPGYVTGLQLVSGKGDVIECNATTNAETFEAARIALGALGIVTEIRLQNRAPYRLHRAAWVEEFDAMVDKAESLAAKHRNFEFYTIPYSERCLAITHDETDAPIRPRQVTNDDEGLEQLKLLEDWLGWSNWLRRKVTNTIADDIPREEHVDRSWKIYPSDRAVRFNEMEYHLPAENGPAALRAIKRAIEDNDVDVWFPFEYRFVKGDSMWLSPFHGRDSVSIAVHRYFKEDYQPLFKVIEPIFRKFGGRPHWGKLHTMNHQELAAAYPRLKDFNRIRQELDPGDRFLSPYLRSLLTGA